MPTPKHASGLAACLAVLLLFPLAALAGPVEKGRRALEAGDYEAAAAAFADALEDGSDRDAAYGLAEAVVAGGLADRARAAREALFDVQDEHPEALEVHLHLGAVSILLGLNGRSDREYQAEMQEAQGFYEEAARIAPEDARAAAGLGRALYEQARFDEAEQVLQAFITEHPQEAGLCHYWLGQVHYYRAQQAHAAAGGGYPLGADVASLFRKAQGAYRAGSRAQPDHFDTWMQLAYASQYLSDIDEAVEAYRKAVAIDGQSTLPLKGLSAVLQHDTERHARVLAELADAHPDAPAVALFQGFALMQEQDWREARRVLVRGAEHAEQPAMHWYYVGEIERQLGDAEAAKRAYRKSLEADPGNARAAAGWEAAILGNRSPAQIAGSLTPSNFQALVRQYEEIFELNPENIYQRNNLGLILRDAYVGHGMTSAYDPLLHRGTAAYVKASEVIGPVSAEMMNLPFATRYGYAQVLSDTGLMFQFHEPNRDWEKAEAYYLRALEVSDEGYYDAFVNLSKIYEAQEAWDALYNLAEGCAGELGQGGLVRGPQGTPHEQGRARARGTMKRLLDEGKVE